MEVLSWSGDWNLPSIDISCLEVLAYAKFAGCPLRVNQCNNPRKSPIGEFPVLQSGEDVLTTSSKIMDYLREKNFNADYQLTAKQGADTLAFVSLVHSKLYPAISFTFWMDDKNYTKFTRPWYAHRLPFPLNYFVPGRISRQTRYQISEGMYSEETDDVLENKLFKDALECLKLLSTMLDGKEFFFGDSPTTLDAVVFAHLAVIWKAPLPNNKLFNYLQGYDNLCMFCGRILQRYFPQAQQEEQQQPSQSSSAQDDTVDSTEKRNKWLALGFAGLAMTLYALFSGLVQVEITRVGDDDLNESTPDMSAFTFRGQEKDGENTTE
ncbi:metaxin 1 [Desmophyllum pertusum]|uniref:Metaxin 1 n=1 Tax=Desmophyllum pertusum TaxID=174260 RepID=A0A9W9ZF09_9CNID|nr:metaxin 1 [Desmophyllum pertusum]